ncbi:MAG: cation:proton antiporter [Muribaculaceae bacterium]|nr:cation:proton antiporter [Muribaculaceae bacterium]
MTVESLINDLALILVLGAVVTVLFKKLKQPVVLGYIVAGFIASPHFSLFPSVTTEVNIEFWAQIGIVILLFSLGLEFSFKKLLAVGAPAVMTALIIVVGMMGLGFLVGKLLGFAAVDSIFLGGMISMSSTTIILKALTDLNMRQRRFVPMIFAVLIVEDLFAVVMMVVLSSVAINKTVESGEMLRSVLKLSFFLVMWFTVGVFLLPSLFKRYRSFLTDEIMLIIAMGLCFLMAVFSVKSGFSLALGAFVMGSILAGTVEAERIERIITPVKDLFGAVFFISVGMMVDPAVIVAHAGTIALLSIVVVVGMILFGTFGMLATGQPLSIAMESGFALTQIGEFSFIIASLGMTLGVLQPDIYPIIVAVSVITTFTTPFFIKGAIPAYRKVESILPKTWTVLLEGYSKNATQSQPGEGQVLLKAIITRYVVRLLLYTVVIIALIMACRTYLMPLANQWLGGALGRLTGVGLTLLIISPFLYAIILPAIKSSEKAKLSELWGRISYLPLVLMALFSLVLTAMLIVWVLSGNYSSHASIIAAVIIVQVLALVLAPFMRKRLRRIEERFIGNVNVRENRRTGRNNVLVSDLHLAYMTVGHNCPFVGERLKNADIRRRYGVNVVYIQRNGNLHAVPTGDMRIFPGDVLGVIGNDEQIQAMLPLVEASAPPATDAANQVRFLHFALGENSPLVGKTLRNARLREDYSSMLVAVERGEEEFVDATPDLEFMVGDIVWVVGDPTHLSALKG